MTGDDRWLVVADSSRSSPRSGGNLAIIDARAALQQQEALLGYAPAGAFPREVAAMPHRNAVVVISYNSQQVEIVDLANLRQLCLALIWPAHA